jgi:protein-S-isoprenylcysteine O-methyltransferase Ste14
MLYAVWFVWAAIWVLMASWSAKAAARAGPGAQAGYILLTVAGFFLLFSSFDGRVLVLEALWRTAEEAGVPVRLWTAPPVLGWAMVVLASAGFAFALWARLHLGRLWSGDVQAKADHRVVDDGPYGIVRHPIYTGLLAAALALAVVKGLLPSLIGAGLTIAGFRLKARLEERLLAAELGEGAYEAYRRRTPMLVPFGPR